MNESPGHRVFVVVVVLFLIFGAGGMDRIDGEWCTDG